MVLVRLPLVGRGREVALIEERLDATVRGEGGALLLAGEPGTGKTRLLREASGLASDRGFTVLHGGASDMDGMPPFLPFLEALGRYIRRTEPEILRDQAGPAASILAGILPELLARLGELPLAYALPPDQARLRLFEAVGGFLAAIAAQHPLLLVLDDLHWAESATLDLLLHVAVHQAGNPILVLGAYRDAALERGPALERTLAELTRRRLLTGLHVGRLDVVATAALAASCLAGPVRPDAAELLYAHSEGNPFFAEELLQSWLESELLVYDGETWRLSAAPQGSLPRGIAGTVRQRLARLPLPTLQILRAGAVAGRRFALALLAQALDQDAEAVEDRLGEAVRSGLLLSDPPDGYRFSHDKIRECLHDELSLTRRMRLHISLGRAIEAQGPEGGAQRLAELAFHFARGGDRERGVAYSRRAAENALQTFAADEAAYQYRAALDLVEASDNRRSSLLLGLGEALLLAGRMSEAVAYFAEAQKAGASTGDHVVAARAAYGLGRARARLEDHGPALAALEQALALAGDETSALAVQVRVELANLLVVSLGRHTEGLAYGQQAQALAERLDDRRLEAAASRTAGNLLARTSDLSGGLRLMERALAIAEANDDPVEAAECCACLLPACYWAGEIRRVHALATRRLAHAERCHDPFQLRHATAARAVPYIVQGRWAEAEAVLAGGRSRVERLESVEPLAFLNFIEGKIALMRGQYAEAEPLLAAAMTTFRTLGPTTLTWYLGVLGVNQLALGRRRDALATMAELESALSAVQPGSMPTTHALDCLGLMAVRLGDARRAAGYYAELAVFGGQCGNFVIDVVLGQIATLTRNYASAAPHLAAAEAAARRELMRPALAETLVSRAELALVSGGRKAADEARPLLDEALALFEQLGNESEVALTRGRLVRLGTPARTRLPAGLTEREAAVLRLVAAGRSNRDIGAELALSEKTVANHITAIFTKTGTDNRAGAAAFAIRRGLG